MRVADTYTWADDDADLVLTAAVIGGSSADEVVRIYGANPSEQERLSFNDAWPPQDDFGKYFYAQVFIHDRHVIVIEPNGWAGAIAEIARRASRAGRFTSVSWNMTGAYRVIEAQNGKVTAHFDPFAVGYPGGMGDLQPDWIESVAFRIEHPNASCLAALELRTGVAFNRAWLIEPLPTYRIPNPDVFLADVEDARQP
jgi:hypothetical protein